MKKVRSIAGPAVLDFGRSAQAAGISFFRVTGSAANAASNLEIRKKQEKNGGRITSERKLITSLFVDISGYTTFSERLDPEEVKDLVSYYIRRNCPNSN